VVELTSAAVAPVGPEDHVRGTGPVAIAYLDLACPHCAGAMHRSHARSLPERVKRGFSHQRLFRCDSCGWRGWLVPLEFGDHQPMEARPAPDLSSLDSVSYPIQGQPRQTFAPRNLQ